MNPFEALWAMALLVLAALQPIGFSIRHEVRVQIGKIEQDLVLFRLKKKRPPAAQAELYGNEPVPTDPWGDAYTLEAGQDGELVVVSHGADGVPSGSGIDEDMRGSQE